MVNVYNVYIAVRTLSVILLLTCGLLTLISGIMLETAPHGPGSSCAVAFGLKKSTWTDIHRYSGFIAAGAAITHIYINYRGIVFHLRRLIGK